MDILQSRIAPIEDQHVTGTNLAVPGRRADEPFVGPLDAKDQDPFAIRSQALKGAASQPSSSTSCSCT